jgi:2-methylcitrate dehydratase PrpD
MTEQPLIARLAHHLQRPVPEYVRTKARLHLLDWLACVAGARHSDMLAYVRRPILGITDYGMLGSILEMDDVHRLGLLHPGPVIWPSSLRSERYDLEACLNSAVIGYEAMIAVGTTLDAHHYAYFHPTSTAGAFGATMAQADGLDPAQLANALALAGSTAGGLWQTRHSENLGKQWHCARAVEAGFHNALGARCGVTGPLDILEGPQGLYAAMCREPKPMVFTDHWRIEEVSFKPWAACRHAHPAIDCALELRADGRLTAPYRLVTYADALTFCDKPHPETETEAKFSLQHAIAVIADGRGATPADFTLEAIAALAPLRAQVTVAEDPAITARRNARGSARLNGFELTDCRGDPERPMAEADIIAKMHMLADWGGLPASEADRAADLALRGDDAGAIVAMLEEWLS